MKPKAKLISTIRENCNKWQKDNKEIENIRLSIKDGNPMFFEEDNVLRTMDGKIWIPKSSRIDFIVEFHSKLCHAGVKKCEKYLEPNFAMENMKVTLKEVIESCEICQKRKTFTGKTKECLISRKEVQPFDVIFADFCGPLRITKHGRRYILAIIDSKTKYIVLKAVNHQDEVTTVNVLKYDWILKFGAPKVLHTDKGRSFEGKAMMNLAKECGFKMEYSSPYHHSSNGQIERQFRTIRDAIATKINEINRKDWAEYLPEIEFMMNATYQKTLAMSPAKIFFGKKIYRENVNSAKFQ